MCALDRGLPALGKTGLLDISNLISAQLNWKGLVCAARDDEDDRHRCGLTQDVATISVNRAHDTVLKAGMPVVSFLFKGRMIDTEESLLDQGSINVLDVVQSKQVCLQSLISMFVLPE
jgi:hypothetical protein